MPVTLTTECREKEYAPIERRLLGDRQPCGNELSERRDRQLRDEEAGAAAKERQHDTLGSQLPNDSLSSRTERGPHRDLALARNGAGQQQVREVGAREEQDAQRGTAQRQQEQTRFARELVAQMENADPRVLELLRIFLYELRVDDLRFTRSVVERYTGAQPTEHLEQIIGPVGEQRCAEREWHPRFVSRV